ncbi:MAG: hypothetical protein ACQGQO_06210, partial [Sphaerochaetaceae bacterium]
LRRKSGASLSGSWKAFSETILHRICSRQCEELTRESASRRQRAIRSHLSRHSSTMSTAKRRFRRCCSRCPQR